MLTETSYQKIHDIATLSTVKRELIEISSDIANYGDRIIEFIIYDPALTLTVLRTVNSAYFGFPRFIKTVPQAVSIIGSERVLHIALSTTELVRHQEETNIKGLTIRRLWDHSIATAIAASEIAKKVYTNIEDEVFVCGLLHDIGKIGLIQHDKEYIKKVVSITRRDHSLFINGEQELSMFDHSMIGAQIVKEWSLPEIIKYAIKFHHKPFESERFQKHVLIVNLADILARSLVIGNPGDLSIPKLTSAVLIELELEMSTFLEIFANVLNRCNGKVDLYQDD